MNPSIHKYVLDALRVSNLDDVHRDTDIPRETLRKIRDRYIENPGIKSMEVLYFHFRKTEGKRLRRRA